LEEQGIRTSAPFLPSSEWPDREGWKQAVLNVYDPQKETILVGRSLGGTLIPYVLEDIQVKAAISIAAPINHLGWENLMDFFSEEPDYTTAREHVEHYEHWYSDDDPYVALEHGKAFQKLLGGELQVFKGYSHFYNTEFPELLQSIQKLLI
jgi:predicted alpha/beta hydrolase family esterase